MPRTEQSVLYLVDKNFQIEPRNNEIKPGEEQSALFKGTKRDFKDLDSGWAWVALFASFGIFSLLGGAMYTVGIIHSCLIERYNASSLLTSVAGAFHTALIPMSGPISSEVANKFSCRAAMVSSGFLYVVGYLGTAFAPSIEAAIFTYGILSGFAGGLAYTANTVVISYYFDRKRNLAIGISNSGLGAGLFLFAPLMQFILDFYGQVGFFIIMAGIFCNLITLGTLCFPSEFELYIKEQRSKFISESFTGKFSTCNILPPCTSLRTYWDVFTNKGIFCYCVANFCFCTAMYLLYLHFPSFIAYKGFSRDEAAILISISGVFNVLGRLLCGVLANLGCISGIAIYSVTMGIVSFISFVYPSIAENYFGHVAYFSLLGLFLGPSAVIATNVSLKFVTVESIATALGLQFLSAGIGAVVGPVITGMLLDKGLSYDVVIYFAACLATAATVIGGITGLFENKHQQKEEVYFDTY